VEGLGMEYCSECFGSGLASGKDHHAVMVIVLSTALIDEFDKSFDTILVSLVLYHLEADVAT
jgi:hypothetical protein